MILVTGGTGLVGSHLLYFLLKENKSVRAIHRASSDLDSVKRVFRYYSDASEEIFDKIEWVVADITDVPTLERAFEGITMVYHAAAYINFNSKKYHALKKANIEGTANVVNLSLAYGVTKLCHVSSVATLGKAGPNALISESTDWNPEANNSLYGITKYGAEMEVWRASQEGLNVVMINPAVILVAGYWENGSGSLIKRAATKRGYYTSGRMGFVDVQDVVRAMITLMQSDINNQRYVLVGANMSYQKLQTALASHFKKKSPKSLSRSAMLWLNRMDWFSHTFFGSKRRMQKRMVDFLFAEAAFDSTKIINEIGFVFTPIERTLKRVAERYSMSS
jgi:dihydroflavonol-4-reductase